MEVKREKILDLIYSSIKAINEGENKSDPLELKEDTRLLGRESKLNSLTLVTLIIDIEQRLYDELGAEISLTDEKAMSLQRSPFLSVGSLTDYTFSLLEA